MNNIDLLTDEMEYLNRQIENLPYNKEREEKIRYAIKRADEAHLHEWRFNFRYELCRWMFRCGDEGQILPLLSELVSIFEEHPYNNLVDCYLYTLYRSLYQWDCFSQLALEERKKVADYFYKACKRYNANLGAYYEREFWQFLKEGKMELAEKNYKRMKSIDKRKSEFFNSCPACVQYRRVEYAIEKKDWKMAIKEAKPMISGQVTCEQHPKLTISDLMIFALDLADWKEAGHYAKLLERAKSPDYDDHDWTLMRYYAFTELEKGKNIFCKELPYILDLHVQEDKERFFLDSYVFWTQYAKKYDTVTLILPKNFALYQENRQYQTKVLADWFYEQALTIAKQFDARNGYPYYQNKIEDTIAGMKKLEKE